MFGFFKHSRTDLYKAPVPAAQQWNEDIHARIEARAEDIVLVSREDIYSNDREHVLLMAEGTEFEPALLPKFMKYGVSPSQFYIRDLNAETGDEGIEALAEDETMPDPRMRRAHSNPLSAVNNVITPLQRTIRQGYRVMVLDEDARHLGRLTQCLLKCGFNAAMIQPIRKAEHLGWALDKYCPHILLLNQRLQQRDASGIDLIEQEIHGLQGAQQIILMVDPDDVPPAEQDRFLSRVRALEVDVILKPVHRFALNQLFHEPENDAAFTTPE
ncbi:MAG: hypothetical protein AB7P76_10705 [Candidatus Melainabacteria bacterium]